MQRSRRSLPDEVAERDLVGLKFVAREVERDREPLRRSVGEEGCGERCRTPCGVKTNVGRNCDFPSTAATDMAGAARCGWDQHAFRRGLTGETRFPP